MVDLNESVRPCHPVAEAFPMMAGADFDRLVDDIRSHGLREAIWLDGEGRILDGRNRDRACRLAAVPPAYRIYDGDDPTAFIVSLNLHRRHLSDSQRAMVAARLVNIRQGEIGKHRAISETQICVSEASDLVNTSKRSVNNARRVGDKGSALLQDAVDQGLVAVSDAAAIVDRPPDEQDALVDGVRSGTYKTLRRAAAVRRREQRETPPADLPAHDGRLRLFAAAVADALEHIAPGSVDCIVTDPPYPRACLAVYGDLARTAARVLRPGGSCLVMAGQSYLPEIIAAMTPHLRYHWTVAYLTPGGQSVQLWERKVNTFWKPVLWFVAAYRMAVVGPLNNILGSIFGAIGGSVFGGTGTVATTSSGTPMIGDFPISSGSTMLAHTGGVIGRDAFPTRRVDPRVFDEAFRYHRGGIVGSEMPIVARSGEGVFTPGQMRGLAPISAARPTVNVVVNVRNTAPGTRASADMRREPGGDLTLDIMIEKIEGGMARNIGRGQGMAPTLERRYGLNPAAGSLR